MSFRRDTFETVVARGAVIAANLFTSILVARALGPGERGVLAYVVLVPTTLYTLLNLGLASSTTYFVGQLRVKLGRILTRTLVLTLAATSLATIATWAFLTRGTPAESAHASLAAIYCIFLFAFASTDPVIMALKQFRIVNALAFSAAIASLGAVLALQAADVLTTGSYLSVLVATTAASATAKAIWVARRGAALHAAALTGDVDEPLAWGELARFSLGMYANNVIWLLILKVDQFIVRHFMGDYGLGLYAIAAGLAESFRMLPSLIGSVVFPYAVQMRHDERRRFLSSATGLVLWASLAIAIVLGMVAGPLVAFLYGAEYLGAASALALLLTAIALLSVGDLLSYHFIADGQPGVVTLVSLAALALNVVLNFVFVPTWGIAGAAFASFLAYGAISLAIAWLLRRRAGYRLRDVLIPRHPFVDPDGRA